MAEAQVLQAGELRRDTTTRCGVAAIIHQALLAQSHLQWIDDGMSTSFATSLQSRVSKLENLLVATK
ncbi:hypothetical protein ACFSX5_15465 [Devosia albogilva]|uniref:Uncharacterized protein n=1 Tax=Devosia albogilva TaxID=429726 RepID=A0ABW5QN47_9HYPH